MGFLSHVTWLRRATDRFLLNDPSLAVSDASDLAAAVADQGGWDVNPEHAVDDVFRRERAATAGLYSLGQVGA